MYLYIAVLKNEPVLKIGVCSNFKRIKALGGYLPLNLANSYYVSSEERYILKSLEKHLLLKFEGFPVDEAFKVKYRLGIAYLSPHGYTELRSIDCLQDVLGEITKKLSEQGSGATITKGIPLSFPKGGGASFRKKVTNEHIWYDSLHGSIFNLLHWLKDPANSFVYRTEGVFSISMRDYEDFTIECDGAAFLHVRKLMLLWVHPSYHLDLVKEVQDNGDGTFAITCSMRAALSRDHVKKLYGDPLWYKRLISLFTKYLYAVRSVIGQASERSILVKSRYSTI
ncbi:hypothetical protein [Rufibacter soli]